MTQRTPGLETAGPQWQSTTRVSGLETTGPQRQSTRRVSGLETAGPQRLSTTRVSGVEAAAAELDEDPGTGYLGCWSHKAATCGGHRTGRTQAEGTGEDPRIRSYLSSLVTIATPTRRTAPAGIFHWSSPKPTLPLAVFPSSSLLPMTGNNCKNH